MSSSGTWRQADPEEPWLRLCCVTENKTQPLALGPGAGRVCILGKVRCALQSQAPELRVGPPQAGPASCS